MTRHFAKEPKNTSPGPTIRLTMYADRFTRDELYDYFMTRFIPDMETYASTLCADDLAICLRDEALASVAPYAALVKARSDQIAAIKKYNDDLDIARDFIENRSDISPGFMLSPSTPPPPICPPFPIAPVLDPPTMLDYQNIIFRMDIDTIRGYLTWLPSEIRYLCIGAEYGPQEHRLHYHAVITFDTAVSDHLAFIAEVLRSAIDVSPDIKPVDNRRIAENYACKANDYRCSHFTRKGFDDPSTVTLRRWQKDLIELPNLSRQVICIIDRNGGHGKSYCIRYLESLTLGLSITNLTSPKDITQHLHNMFSKALYWVNPRNDSDYMQNKTIAFDIPRARDSSGQSTLWQSIEQLKNGHLVDTRYESSYITFYPPKVVAFCNYTPHIDDLSLDRWLIYDISDMPVDDSTTPLETYRVSSLDLILDSQISKADYITTADTLPSELNALPHVDFKFDYQPGCGERLTAALVDSLDRSMAIGLRISKWSTKDKNPLIRFWRIDDLAKLLNIPYLCNADIVEIGFALRDYTSPSIGRKRSTYDFINGRLQNYAKLIRQTKLDLHACDLHD